MHRNHVTRLAAALAVGLIALAAGIPGGGVAPVAASSYTHNCSEDVLYTDPYNEPHYKVYRYDHSSPAAIRGGHARIDDIENLFTCANPTANDHGFTAIMAVSLQQGTTNHQVQLGVGENNYAGTTIGYHTTPVFVWTSTDDSFGTLRTLTWAETPQYGHAYGFTIDMSVCELGDNMPCWRFTIYDYDDGQSWYHEIHRHWNNSSWNIPGYLEPSVPGTTYAADYWGGYETSNSSGLLGRKNTDTPSRLYYQTWRGSDGNWHTHSSATMIWLVQEGDGTELTYGDPGYPTWYKSSETSGSGYFWGYTNPW
jgi:hypothetical protein